MALLYPSQNSSTLRTNAVSQENLFSDSGVAEDKIDADTAALIALLAIQDLEELLETAAARDKGKGRAGVDAPLSDETKFLQAKIESYMQVLEASEDLALANSLGTPDPDVAAAVAALFEAARVREEAIEQDHHMAEMMLRGDELPPPSPAQQRVGEGEAARVERVGPLIPVPSVKQIMSQYNAVEVQSPLFDVPASWDLMFEPLAEEEVDNKSMMRPLVPVSISGSGGGNEVGETLAANWITITEDNRSITEGSGMTKPHDAPGAGITSPSNMSEDNLEKCHSTASAPERPDDSIQGLPKEMQCDDDWEHLVAIFAEIRAGNPPSSSSKIQAVGGPGVIGTKMVPCIICTDELRSDKALHTACDHYYCPDCVTSLVYNTTRDEELFPIRCCLLPIPIAQITPFLNSDLQTEFAKKQAEYVVPAAQRLYCARTECGTFLGPSQHGTAAGQACPTCNAETCPRCMSAAHGAEDCASNAAAVQLLTLAGANGWQTCPGCKWLVERKEGCCHMTCRCKTQFCYRCAALWENCACQE